MRNANRNVSDKPMTRVQLEQIAPDLSIEVWRQLSAAKAVPRLEIRGRCMMGVDQEALLEILADAWHSLVSHDQFALIALVRYGNLPGPLDREQLEALEDAGFYDLDRLAVLAMGTAAVERYGSPGKEAGA